MAFQLVRAGDDEIVVWQTDHGHIYAFAVEPGGLSPVMVRDAPGSTIAAGAFAAEALAFASSEARERGFAVMRQPVSSPA